MYIDDMPMWALVGDFGSEEGATEPTRGGDVYIFTHKTIDIGYNGDRIVDVAVTTGKRELLEPGKTLRFSYEVGFLIEVSLLFFSGSPSAVFSISLCVWGNLTESRPISGRAFVPVANINPLLRQRAKERR